MSWSFSINGLQYLYLFFTFMYDDAVLITQRDGTLRRVHQPLNTIDPYKSLLKPLYCYDIDRVMKTKKSLARTTQKSLATVVDSEEDTQK